jgi:predicted XRE-type DNA-binding protein
MREEKLRSGVNWQRWLEQKGVKQKSVKQGLGV